jgi:hypothetical protein
MSIARPPHMLSYGAAAAPPAASAAPAAGRTRPARAAAPAAAQGPSTCRDVGPSDRAVPLHASTALPPPQPPRAPVTPRTAQAYAVLADGIQSVLGTLQAGLPAISWGTLAPRVTPCADAATAAAQGEAQAAATTATLHKMVAQLDSLNGPDTFVAFMMLRLQGQSHGLHVAQQLGDMASSLRRHSLNKQQAFMQTAQKHVERAIRLQHVEQVAAPALAGITGAVNVGLALMCASAGPGLALAVTGIALGFAGGGIVGGRRQEIAFDLSAAVQGASMGAAILPMMQLTAVLAASLAGGTGLGATTVLGAFRSKLAASLTAASQMLQTPGAQSAKGALALQIVAAAAGAVAQSTVAALNGAIAMRNFDAQMALALGNMCGQAARVAQTNWKNTTNFLSAMQEAHNDAVKQVMTMLSLHHRTALKAMRA